MMMTTPLAIGPKPICNLLFVLKELGTQFSFVDSQHHEY
ncbi:hypothetical protein BBM1605_04880 [Bifidobacterium breve MCC 1605]|nr:hypothetical protein BBM1605_04880 [Bifidobacterium breve MCC 1605]